MQAPNPLGKIIKTQHDRDQLFEVESVKLSKPD